MKLMGYNSSRNQLIKISKFLDVGENKHIQI